MTLRFMTGNTRGLAMIDSNERRSKGVHFPWRLKALSHQLNDPHLDPAVVRTLTSSKCSYRRIDHALRYMKLDRPEVSFYT